jgi:uncharacterized protein YjbI with pentapeptide repeats
MPDSNQTEVAKPGTNRTAWWLCAVLGAVVLVASGLLFARMRPNCIARFRGRGANLAGAYLRGAQLPGVDLAGADLSQADLRQANLSKADLNTAHLRRARLAGTDLRRSFLWQANLSEADLRAADLRGALLGDLFHHTTNLRGARYDLRTRWPAGFDPRQYGAVLMK